MPNAREAVKDPAILREEIGRLIIERDRLIVRRGSEGAIVRTETDRLLKNIRSKISVRRRKIRQAGESPGKLTAFAGAAVLPEDNGARTHSMTVAMCRIAKITGHKVVAARDKGWWLTTPNGDRYTHPMTAENILGSLIVVATWPAPAGLGMSYVEVARKVKLDHPYEIAFRNATRWFHDEVARMLRAEQTFA